VGSESAALVSDDAFFSSGAQTGGRQSTSHSLSSHSETYVMTPLTDTSSSIPTEEMSGSGTVVLLMYQREGTSHLDSSAGAGCSAFTSDLLSRTTGLTLSRTVRTPLLRHLPQRSLPCGHQNAKQGKDKSKPR